jgi:hypothetical protein
MIQNDPSLAAKQQIIRIMAELHPPPAPWLFLNVALTYIHTHQQSKLSLLF